MWNMFKVKKKNTRHWRRSGVFIVNFKHISHLFLVFQSLNLNLTMFLGVKPIMLRQKKL